MARDLIVLAIDGVHMSSVGLFLDLFEMMRRRVADQFRSRDDVGMQTRAWLLGLNSRPVRTAGDRLLHVDGGIDESRAHMLVHVPDFDCPYEELPGRLHGLRGMIDWIQRQHRGGAYVSATGRGIYLLAEGGLIGNGPVPMFRDAATEFRFRYPHIGADTRLPIVDHERVMLARGVAHEMGMFTRLISLLMSYTMAGALAEAMGVAENERSGLSDDTLVAAGQIWLAQHAASGARISELAAHLAVSQQTLIRRFRAKLGMTPRAYLRYLRVISAQPQLRETDRPIGQIATIVGYDDLKSFQDAFRAHTGMTPTQYRRENRAAGRLTGP